MKEYLLADKIINNYNIKLLDSFNDAKIKEVKLIDDYYFVICEVDNKEGYCYFPKYELESEESNEVGEDKKELVTNEIEVSLDTLLNNLYFIIGDELLSVEMDEENKETITINELKNLMVIGESGE